MSTDINGKAICVKNKPEAINRFINYAGVEYQEHDPLSVKSNEAKNLMKKIKRKFKKNIQNKIQEEQQIRDDKIEEDIGHAFSSDKPLAAQLIAQKQRQE